MLSAHNIPLSLYIHMPWCIRKCPYCDFNSHAVRAGIPEDEYIMALLNDLDNELEQINQRSIQSIFFGGGTPSLFSPSAIATLLSELNKRLTFAENIEITLEANPGTVEQARFNGFKQAGVNRLSIGIQSFQDNKLKALGRIHGQLQAINAAEAAHVAGFNNFNLDLMYGLPQQTVAEACADLETAISLQPTHISWYQLTLEPNTLFYHKPPVLPVDDIIWDMQKAGQALLQEHNVWQYEISAYAKSGYQCQHNLNYWQFGDYLGIGAGAHGKVTLDHNIIRTWKTKHPNDYLNPATPFLAGTKIISIAERPLEFMLNTMRLNKPITAALYESRTGLPFSSITPILQTAKQQELIDWQNDEIIVTGLGRRYLNDLLELFLPSENK